MVNKSFKHTPPHTHGMSHADTNTDPGLGQTQTYANAKLGNNNPTLPLYK